ncbi:DUF3618 domain-containing protein [Kribbella qitaiheensis]|uniref:DUF3618 domain-containing protein n=1 Tax=Kribbella qitaiheensis TaxID=1544730 RepID=A0A7G6X2F4_9ACTN|nr:DUF3618 domain-containing protein [Kribbella qitaiheensis]QNE20419.1 DUF3618 domain-containing protein [Kribbella qitaiheensis]
MTTTKDTQLSETEALRADLQMTRQHLADTVQELSYQLNFPRRIKESAANAGHRAAEVAGTAGHRAAGVAGTAGQRAKQVPALTRQHPRAVAAIGGAVALGVGAAAWIAGRGK